MTYTKRHWQNLAQEALALAADATDANVKRTLLMIADNYDRLASLAEGPNGATEISH